MWQIIHVSVDRSHNLQLFESGKSRCKSGVDYIRYELPYLLIHPFNRNIWIFEQSVIEDKSIYIHITHKWTWNINLRKVVRQTWHGFRCSFLYCSTCSSNIKRLIEFKYICLLKNIYQYSTSD